MSSSMPVFSKDKQSDVIKIRTEGERKKQQKTSRRKTKLWAAFFQLKLIYSHLSFPAKKLHWTGQWLVCITGIYFLLNLSQNDLTIFDQEIMIIKTWPQFFITTSNFIRLSSCSMYSNFWAPTGLPITTAQKKVWWWLSWFYR